MAQDQQTYRRAAGAALIGLFVQLALCAGMTLLGLWTSDQKLDDPTRAVTAAALHLLGGLPIWVILWMVYNQHRLERAEALEAEELTRQQAQRGAMFDEQAQDLALTRRRLQVFYTWSIPLVSLVLALYLIGAGLLQLLRNLRAFGPMTEPGWQAGDSAGPVVMAVAAVVGFVAFVVARYIAGMTAVAQWQRLRGGASYLMGNAVAATLLMVGAIVHYWTGVAIDLLTLILPALMALIGVEMVLSLVLGFYSPRRPGEWPRPAFESRLLSWLTSPESIARIIRETINYQFGIEVSRSWFYQLLSRAVTPLAAAGLAVLVLISSIAAVGPQQQAIILRFGGRTGPPVGPGIYLKWPWPISTVQRFDVGRVLDVSVGSVVAQPPRPEGDETKEPAILWTNQHAGKEEYLLAAPTPLKLLGGGGDEPGEKNKASGKVLLGVQVLVQYRVSDLGKYIVSSRDPQEWFHVLVQRQVSEYIAGHDIDALLGTGRLAAGPELKTVIENDPNVKDKLGVDVLFVGVTGVHPPAEQDVAKAFLQVIGARQAAAARLEEARRKEIEILAGVAGSSEQGRQIYQGLIDLDVRQSELDALRVQTPLDNTAVAAKQKEVADLEATLEGWLTAAKGDAAQRINLAWAQRWGVENAERARSDRFAAEVRSYRIAPRYYVQRQWLDALATGLVTPRKYLVDVGGQAPPVFRLELQDTGTVLDLSNLGGR